MKRNSTAHANPLEALIFHVMFNSFYPSCDTPVASVLQAFSLMIYKCLSFPAAFSPWSLSQGHIGRGTPHLPGEHYVVSGMQSMSAAFLQSLLQLLEGLPMDWKKGLTISQGKCWKPFSDSGDQRTSKWGSELFLHTGWRASTEKEKPVQM